MPRRKPSAQMDQPRREVPSPDRRPFSQTGGSSAQVGVFQPRYEAPAQTGGPSAETKDPSPDRRPFYQTRDPSPGGRPIRSDGRPSAHTGGPIPDGRPQGKTGVTPDRTLRTGGRSSPDERRLSA